MGLHETSLVAGPLSGGGTTPECSDYPPNPGWLELQQSELPIVILSAVHSKDCLARLGLVHSAKEVLSKGLHLTGLGVGRMDASGIVRSAWQAGVRELSGWACQVKPCGSRRAQIARFHLAAADAAFHSAIADSRKRRIVFREIRWRWVLKVL